MRKIFKEFTLDAPESDVGIFFNFMFMVPCIVTLC